MGIFCCNRDGHIMQDLLHILYTCVWKTTSRTIIFEAIKGHTVKVNLVKHILDFAVIGNLSNSFHGILYFLHTDRSIVVLVEHRKHQPQLCGSKVTVLKSCIYYISIAGVILIAQSNKTQSIKCLLKITITCSCTSFLLLCVGLLRLQQWNT